MRNNQPDATQYPIFLENLSSDRLSLLLAAELMQTLAAAPKHAYSKATLLCYYWIARELYTADAPDWSIGGARAAPAGRVSAFVTNKCVLSVVRFAHAQECTARFIDCLCAFKEKSQRLAEEVRGIPKLPSEYKKQEEQRLRYSCYIALQRYGKTLALPLKRPESPDTIVGDLATILDNLAGTVAHVENSFVGAVTEIVDYRQLERTRIDDITDERDREEQKRNFARSAFGHERARLALNQGLNITKEVRQLLEVAPTPDGVEILKRISNELRQAAERVRRMLQPCHTFLSSVLDRELAAVSLGSDSTWEPPEMAFAAASLGILEKRWREDGRLRLAVLQLSSAMSDRGRLPYGRPFHEHNEDTEFVYPASVLRACADLARCVGDPPVDLDIARKMLRYFSENRVSQSGIDTDIIRDLASSDGYKKHGWCFEYASRSPRFMEGPTMASVRALAAINRMLDDHINRIILRYFRVKTPDRDLQLDLEELFYPDYGLSLIPDALPMPEDTRVSGGKLFDDAEWPDVLRPEESVSVTLQRMRAHVIRVPIPKAAGDRPFSVVLHGPPGTGKTTLVEALAKSCGIPFVEVTPSDIVVGGEAEVERRASAVFEALTLLTRVVILFDEFDPVLWRRDPAESAPRSVFSFLTPGMLPKLKDLHRWAERRSYCYVLVTNLIGGLDDAAVRDGRFDRKIGIYPPDPHSRMGRFLSEVRLFMDSKEARDLGLKEPKDLAKRVLEVVKNTAGAAMETLGRRGWMTPPDPLEVGVVPSDTRKKLTPFAYVFQNGLKWGLQEADREAYLKDPVGNGRLAIREFMQWWWIVQWDLAIQEAKRLDGVLKGYPKKGDRSCKDLTDYLVNWRRQFDDD